MLLTMRIGLHSAIIRVLDFDRGVDEVARLLGRRPRWLGVDGETGSPIALHALGDLLLEVRGPSDPELVAGTPEAEIPEETPAEGLCGLRLQIDLEQDPAAAELAARVAASGGSLRDLRPEGARGSGDAPDRAWRRLQVDPARSRSIPIDLVSEDMSWLSAREGDSDAGLPPGGVEALDHVVILSADLEASRSFYGTDLGIRLALDRSFEARGVRLLFFRIGGVTLEIGGRLGAEPRPEAPDRFGGLAWRVADADAAHARLSADGFDVSGVRPGHKPGTRVLTVRGPVHGVPTLLIEPDR